MSEPVSRPHFSAKIVASSINVETGNRLDTLQLRYPRMVHADFMTHRDKSRNASSSRAMPTLALTTRDADIYVPAFRKNKPGMQPGAFLTADAQEKAERIWRQMAQFVLGGVKELTTLGVHKQWANRPLEWFGHIEVVCSATQWANFLALRNHDDAQDEIHEIAKLIKEAREAATPKSLRPGEWHLPYVDEAMDDEIDFICDPLRRKLPMDMLEAIAPAFHYLFNESPANRLKLMVSTARSCRVSYSTHDGRPSTLADDLERFRKLLGSPIHASPFEHQGVALPKRANPVELATQANFRGFGQFRKFIPGECYEEPI